MTVISGMSRLIITELETLAYLNPYVMHPFLHCLEQSTQSEPLIFQSFIRTCLSIKRTLCSLVLNIPDINLSSLTKNLGKQII